VRFLAFGARAAPPMGATTIGVARLRPVRRPNSLVVFVLDGQRYGLELSAVERVVRAVAITPLPKGPDIVMGVIDFQGRIIPVVNVRMRFNLPQRGPRLNDQMIIANTKARSVALLVDEASETLEFAAEALVAKDDIAPGIEFVEGVIKLSDGLVLIHDLEKFLSLDEQRALEAALAKD
jgi:purine-binding chemotaxis protein CheW